MSSGIASGVSLVELHQVVVTLDGIAVLEDYSAHDFRHTCATEWKEHSMSLQEVSKLLGHTNTTVTERCYVEFRKHGMNKARIVMNTI